MIRPGLICLFACLLGFVSYWQVNRRASRNSGLRFACPLALVGSGVVFVINGSMPIESMAPFLSLGGSLALLAILPIGKDEPAAATNSLMESHQHQKGNEGQ